MPRISVVLLLSLLGINTTPALAMGAGGGGASGGGTGGNGAPVDAKRHVVASPSTKAEALVVHGNSRTAERPGRQ